MLDPALIALAASGGTAVVTAAGTDAWAALRQAMARWLGRGDPQRERAEQERLEQTMVLVQAAHADQAQRVQALQEGAWQTRIESVLEGLEGSARAQAAEELRGLLAQHAGPGALAGPGGLAAGQVDIRAEHGSIAAGVLHGGAHIAHPRMPDPPQG
ncbi:hypothetical protein [Streptomyces sp. NPDC001137]|uniref:hypothetical protein n=1 Tax=Streptomyces sp. NPDC001137 TaxID=3154378 RepID=UPI0033196210